MKEHEIRPPELVAEASRLAQQDVSRLLTRAHEFVTVDCPACASPDRTLEFNKGGFDFNECRNCGTLYVSPRPSAEMLADYYEHAEHMKFWSKYLYPASASVRIERIFRPRANRIAQILGSTVEVLVDVGAGSGWFAALCAELGLARRVIVVEPNREQAAACRKLSGVEAIEAPIEECYSSLNASVVTCFELIEHLFAPFEFLRACYMGLSPSGLFACTTPNWRGFDIAILRDRSSNVGAPNHLNYFTPTSLSTLLARTGFSEISVTTPGELDVDILYNQINAGVLSPSDLPFWGRVIIEGSEELRQDLQRFLARHGLSSNLMAIARKPG